MKTTLQILREARELLSDNRRWTKGCFARNSDGYGVPATAPSARCFCVVGAMRRVAGIDRNEGLVDSALDALRSHCGRSGETFNSVAMFNDDPLTAHADVLAMFDRAIAAEEARMTEQADTKRAPLDQRDERIERLSEDNHRLVKENAKLRASNGALAKKNADLSERVLDLEAELDVHDAAIAERYDMTAEAMKEDERHG